MIKAQIGTYATGNENLFSKKIRFKNEKYCLSKRMKNIVEREMRFEF